MNPLDLTARPRLVRGSALLGSIAVLALATSPAAYAAGDGSGVRVSNTETVQVYMDSEAKATRTSVYEQLALTGHGKADLTNPVATKGLRNLDGLSGVSVKGQDQVVDTTVDGEKTYRSVSDYTGDLPLDVDVDYTLDGKPVQPGDVVGKSGKLKVTWTVTNRTGREEQVSYRDAQGNTKTTTQKVVIPMVGQLTTTAPSSFEDVSSDQANMAGDGHGGIKLSYTMTLFPPIGAPSSTFGYTANIKDGVVPEADITALPVDPVESPTFAKGVDSYKGGAATGVKLTDGATQVDTNLLKLRDGAAQLLDGLVQLRDGSSKLSDGLSGKAADGSKKLDDGANALSTGLEKILGGTGKLSAGTTKLKGGTTSLVDGAGRLQTGAGALADGTGSLKAGTAKALAGGQELSGGLQKISGGLDQLDSQLGGEESQSGIAQIKNGIAALLAGVGDPDAPANSQTLIGGLKSLNADSGLPSAKAGATQLKTGLQALKGTGNPADGTAGGVSAVKNGLDGAKAQLDDSLTSADKLPKLIATAQALAANQAPGGDCGPGCQQVAGALAQGLTGSKTQLTALSGGLGQLSSGLGNALAAIGDAGTPGRTLAYGAASLESGLTTATAGAAGLQTGAVNVQKGLLALQEGYGKLVTGLLAATTGIGQLDDGAATAYAGSTQLTTGLGALDAGAGKLDAGAGALRAGVVKLADGSLKLDAGASALDQGAATLDAGTAKAAKGSVKLADGTGALSSGILAAAAGSEKITAGLRKATVGAPKIVNGATRLSNEGTKKIIAAGEETASTFAQQVAVVEASAKRAHTDQMAYGAPKDADAALTAYSYEIAGEDGEGSRNVVRTLGGAGVLAASGGVLFLRRRFLV